MSSMSSPASRSRGSSSIMMSPPKSERRPPPVFNPAFTSAAGVTKDPLASLKSKTNYMHTFKSGVHQTQFFVKRTVPKRSGLEQGPEYTGKGTYSGDWQADTATLSSRGWSSLRCGVGTQTFPNGSRYEGMWFNDRQQGEGKLFVLRGAGGGAENGGGSATPGGGSKRKPPQQQQLCLEYSGSWFNGKKHGLGKQTYANGDVYDGMFFHGVRHGEGRQVYSDGTIYTGGWVEDVRSGLGELLLAGGDSYYGAWKGDEKHGHGAYVYRSKGRLLEGEWVGGVAKAGELREIPPALASTTGATAASSSAAATSLPAPIPLLSLLDPEGVLRSALMAATLVGVGVGVGMGGEGGEGASTAPSSLTTATTNTNTTSSSFLGGLYHQQAPMPNTRGSNASSTGFSASSSSTASSSSSTASSSSSSSSSTSNSVTRPGTGFMDGGGGGGEGGLGASEPAAAGAAMALGSVGASGGALDGSLTEENLEMLAMAFTKVDVGNTGYIPADPNALTFILATLNIERPRDEDLEGLLVELVQDTPQEEEGKGGEEGPRISFQAFVKALATIKE